jgi:hypothetical protein
MFESPTKHAKKLYRGAYNYLKKDVPYAEELFEVYRDGPEQTLHFLAKFHSRVSTGELFIVDVDYIITKDYNPISLNIRRSMGQESVEEIFDYNSRKNILAYQFITEDDRSEVELSTPPKFHITAPTACSSMVFLRSKKFDSTSKNHYTFLSSMNQWTFEAPPQFQNIVVQKISQTTDSIVIDGNNLQGTEYKVMANTNEDSPTGPGPGQQPAQSLRIWTSPYATIPYLLRSPDSTVVQVKYLNNLTDRD